MTRKVQALVFDCDGVIVDTELLKFQAWCEALSSFQIELNLEEFTPLIGLTRDAILKAIGSFKKLSIPQEVLFKQKAAYERLQHAGVPPIPAAVAFIKQLAEEKKHWGLKLGLSSSASQSEISINLRHVGLTALFDVIVSGHDDLDAYVDSEGKNKPKPYIYIETAKRLGIEPSCCIAFEDTSAGVMAAASAGMWTVAVPNRLTTQHDFSCAKLVVQSFATISLSELIYLAGQHL